MDPLSTVAASTRPSKAFLLTFLAPGSGHYYVGSRRRGGAVAVITAAILGLAILFAALPPVNFPLLLLMTSPLVALLAFLLAAGLDAVRLANSGATRPADANGTAVIGAALWLAALVGTAALAIGASKAGTFDITDNRMAPTLMDGDRVVVWRDYYRDRLPERGDLAVVMTPGADRPRIMRIVGLPGDSLLSVLGTLTINGKAIERRRIGDFGWRDASGMHRNAPRYEETLPGGRTYEILQSTEGMFRGALLGASLKIPDGDYFVIGDNRDETESSWEFGFLPGLVLSDRPTVVIGSDDRSRIGRSVRP